MTEPRFCLALDVPDTIQAVDWVRRTSGVIGVYKVGLELFCAEGPRIIDAVREAGARHIFLDLKLHDIPRTVASAVLRLRGLGVDYLTVHTSGGRGMMEAAAEASGPMTLLGVTVLTSLDQKDLSDVHVTGTLGDVVLGRAQLAVEAGIGGIVSSAQEAHRLRASLGPTPILVTPGIRFQGQSVGDQKRVFTPADALEAGASMLVLGRAVTQAPDLNHVLRLLGEISDDE